jgi:primosomal protein N' (replication factor Y)
MRALIAQDREAFYDAEIAAREATLYPPFGRLASIVVSGPDKNDTAGYARALARAAPALDLLDGEVRVLGPAEAPLSLVRGRHRFRLLIKAPRGFDLASYLRQWLAVTPKKQTAIKLDIDVDPQSFL